MPLDSGRTRVGRVGPNTVVQLAAALDPKDAHRVFEAAGALAALSAPPEQMVAERLPRALFDALLTVCPDRAEAALTDAGHRTAEYLLANRIPAPAHIVFGLLPATLAARLLLLAIQRSAWTFAGSGHCRTRWQGQAVIEVTDNPLATPGCLWHRAVFERLFRTLVCKTATVRHPACCARGDPVCRFEIGVR